MRAFAAVAVLCLAVLAAGCWDSREPNDMVYAMAVGFDIDDDGQYVAAIQFANPAANQASGGSSRSSSSGQYPFWTYSAKGHTPAEAVAALRPYVPREITLTHAEVLLVSERLARHGIGPILDFIARSWQARLLIAGGVVDGDLMELLRAQSPADPIPALSIRRLLDRVKESEIAPSAPDLLTAVSSVLRVGGDLILPVLKVHGRQSGESGGLSAALEPPAQAPFAHSGAAAFRSDKMVGFIDSKEARGAGFVLNKAGSATIHVDSPVGGLLSIRVVGAAAKLVPSFEDGRVSFLVKVSASGYIEGETAFGASTAGVSDKEFANHVRARLAQAIREDIEAAFDKSLEYGSDFLQLGNAVHRMLPRVWKSEVGDRWYDILQEVTLDIQVETELAQPGLLRQKPLKSGGA